MRTKHLSWSAASILCLAVSLAGCGPQEPIRTAEFYVKPENAAAYAAALEACNKSGLGQKEKCAPVWQAKIALDDYHERKFFEKALAEQAQSQGEGVTLVQQSPKTPALNNVANPAPKPNANRAEAETGSTGRPSAEN